MKKNFVDYRKPQNEEKIEKEIIEESTVIAEPEKRIGIVIPARLNVRAKAIEDAEIVEVILNGTEVEILDEENKFFKIPNGFVMKEFISVK